MHVAWLMGVTRALAENRDKWRGTVMATVQPAEETGEGARAMIRDGMVMEDLRAARHSIHLQYFIWANDGFTKRLKEILVARYSARSTWL